VAPEPSECPDSFRIGRSGRLLALLLALLLAAGCSSWRVGPGSVQQRLAENQHKTIRVYRPERPIVELHDAYLTGDTLVGTRWIEGRGGAPKHVTTRVPLDSIVQVEVYQVDVGRTILVVAAVGATAILIVAAVTFSSSGGSGDLSTSSSGSISCPILASWDGAEWRVDSGTFAGAIMPALARTDVDVLGAARGERGIVRVRLEGAGGEVDHVDAVELVAIEHPEGSAIVPDPLGALHALRDPQAPTGATDGGNRDVLARIDRLDGWGWESSIAAPASESRSAALEGIELTFPRPAGATQAWLVVDGNNTPWGGWLLRQYVALHGRDTEAWMDSIALSPEAAEGLALAIARSSALQVSVSDGDRWMPQGAIPGAGPEVSKRQAIRLDLAALKGDEVRIRLEALPLGWWIDRVSLQVEDERGFAARPASLTRATSVVGGSNRLPTLAAIDRTMLTLQPGDQVALEFAVPAPRADMRQSFVARTTGWYRLLVDPTAEPDRERLATLDRDPRTLLSWSEELRAEALRKLSSPVGEPAPEPAR
jgi:hypothetical protein